MTKEEAIEVFKTEHPYNPKRKDNDLHTLAKAFDMAISALQGGWIPIVVGSLTKEEEAENDGIGYCEGAKYMYDCQMPEDGQEVLVTTRYGDVDTDTFYHDDGWYFENFCDDDDVLAWQPKPEPYTGGE